MSIFERHRSLGRASYPVKKKPVLVQAVVDKKPVYSTKVIQENNLFKVRITKNGKTVFEFMFEEDGTPFCCGLVEFGNFAISVDSDKTISKLEKVKAVKKLMDAAYDNITNDRGNGEDFDNYDDDDDDDYHAVHEGVISCIFTLLDNNVCNLVRDAIKDGKSYSHIKDFINVNTGRTNSLYTSTN